MCCCSLVLVTGSVFGGRVAERDARVLSRLSLITGKQRVPAHPGSVSGIRLHVVEQSVDCSSQ